MSLAQEDKEVPSLSSADTASFKSRKVTTRSLIEMKKANRKIACLTAYDALMAKIFDEAGIDLLLIGDSLGNVVQGHPTTIPVTLEDTIYHTRAVTRGASRALIVADMPFMTYQVTPQEAFRNAGRIMKEAGANAVKLEGGKRVLEAVSLMTDSGIPVMGHLGLTPQSINKFGSYQARGVNPEEANLIKEDALLLEKAGAFSIVLEKIPAELAKEITESLKIPTIGIGAGPYCDGQILVYTDMLGLTDEFNPRFVRRYAHFHQEALKAVRLYAQDIKNNDFPNLQESY